MSEEDHAIDKLTPIEASAEIDSLSKKLAEHDTAYFQNDQPSRQFKHTLLRGTQDNDM